MNRLKFLTLIALFSPLCSWAQQVLPVPVQNPSAPGEEKTTLRGEEKIITGVTEPTISVYLPDEKVNTGTAVILCPGGAMRMLSWTNDVAAVGTFDELTDEQIQRLGMTDTEYQIHAIDVMQTLNDNPQSAFYQTVNMKQVCAMGQSCGGGQALTTAIADPRVTNCVALNSGFVRNKPPFPVEEPGSKRPAEGPKDGWAKKVSEGGLFGKEFGGTMTQADLAKLHSPVVYLIGGPDDVAFPNANENYELVKVPVAVCNLPVGHGATYAEHHGGAFAVIALKWLDWQMKGQTEQNRFFLDEAFQKEKFPQWDVKRKNW